jgi:tRNA (uracil-5-)-methyltransferase TRM9
VIHHFSTRERRVKAVQELLRITRGEILIFVWAMEQSATSKRFFKCFNTIRTFTEQDNFVSWKVPKTLKTSEEEENIAAAGRDESGDLVFQRFYHVFKEGELDSIVVEAGGEVVKSDYDVDNWYIVCKRVEKIK